ncbi:unnamed protein product [Rotaria sordida]|uniref:Uncharacterized protein n=1 Tax=Rotaria sordida TaxID=392033 RepID=A0A815XWU2_9BILA|nr:unnamed protein product [Rotaria sordida]CAF1562757.1 unnamed protein product [Rotaria sordida]
MVRHLRSCPLKTTDSDLSCQQAKINQYYKSTTNELTVVPKPIKDAVTTTITEFVAQDGQAFQLVNIFGFINLAEQLFNSGKLISSSPNIHIANILTDPTTVIASILDNKLLAIYLRIGKDLLTGLCEFLLLFDTVLDRLSDNERPILHRVLLFKQFLINKCEINDDEKEDSKHLNKRLVETWELSNEHLIATLVYPNLKYFHMCPHERTYNSFVKRRNVLIRDTSTATQTSSCSSLLSTTRLSSTKNLLVQIYDKSSTNKEKSVIEQEIEDYLKSKSSLYDEKNDEYSCVLEGIFQV